MPDADSFDGIMLVSFGGPRTCDDVMPFLRNVTRGRGIPDARLTDVAEHYYHFGGASPINEQNDALVAALDAELHARGHRLPIWIGNRNWDPYLGDALTQAYQAGCRSLLTVRTSSYASYSSCRQYTEDLDKALAKTGLQGKLRLGKVRQFFNHPGFVAPFVAGLEHSLDRLQADNPGLTADDVEVIFTGHSLPLGAARSSGFGGWRSSEGGAYVAQHRQVAEQIVAAVRGARDGTETLGFRHWQLAWQSRSGPASQPWLEPDINDAIAELPAVGRKAVITVPISFISDHMEVVWDLDIEAAATAARLGLDYARVPAPGTHPAFVQGLADMIEERLGLREGRISTGAVGPWPDCCPADCCPPAIHPHTKAAQR
ncbi:ferrochelatase [Propionimicrobium sp. PCR01-08-3]|uniref:ferrochelatase n=1 Tax=Propionimicrobium sp. PCR01-08-3 TaxID=3052086 RepID=UPI00255C3FA3|nr:ferrochelatase [Propionimicrobium sp. PCR01-08-3]WIY81630.1 ferrochelatase [Propionimicrobium sp. PCR01-08-3]